MKIFKDGKVYFEEEEYTGTVIYTGAIDELFDYKYGELPYRTLTFEFETLNVENYQGNAVINYTEKDIPHTRIIEHKHFEFGTQPKTIISKEYSSAWNVNEEPYYPINDEKNTALYEKYKALADKEKTPTLIFDEIDTGISGKTSHKIGIKPREVASRNTQVICVTHLAQLAAMADANFFIEKSSDDVRTKTSIRRLDSEGVENEVARLAGGLISGSAINHAKELISEAQSEKRKLK